MNKLSDKKTEKVADIIKTYHGEITNLLVVGCGSGLEAAILSQRLGVNVVGVDIEDEFDMDAKDIVDLRVGDATALEFDDETFDYVYSYHAIEHIGDPAKALSEIKRVLKNGGGYWIGTPNRLRLLGYIGSKSATTKQKILWNAIDWKARLTGKFTNAQGAHAGFSSYELNKMLSVEFSDVKNVTNVYFSAIYEQHKAYLKMLESTGMSKFIYPSVYFTGSK